MGSAATASAATLDEAGTLAALGGVSLGETIGAPIVAFGASGVGAFAIGGGATGDTDGAEAGDGATTGGDGVEARGGAPARRPASVFAIGDIGADSQSSPRKTLPSTIAATTL
jgi:hypothetical protein